MEAAEFYVNESFPYKNSSLKRQGLILVVSKTDVQAEIDLGVHGESKKPISGLLNHCSPFNEVAREMVTGFNVRPYVPPTEAGDEEKALLESEKKAEIMKLHKEFDKLGKAYDPHWQAVRLKRELEKAKREAPVKPPEPQKRLQV